jgi:colanic acid biosynthesis glycosyl transferase WcaI
LYLVFMAKKPDVLLVSYPSLTAGLTAVLAGKIRKFPVVVRIEDLWPDSLPATGMIKNNRLLRLIGWLCSVLYRYVNHIIVISDGCRKLLLNRGVDEIKISVVRNWGDESPNAVTSANLAVMRDDARLKVLFAGNMGASQGLAKVIEAASLVSMQNTEIHFYFVGAGIELQSLKDKVHHIGLKNVTFLPRVPLNEIGLYFGLADVLLVHLRDEPIFAVTIPSKTQAYLRAGKPILMAVRGDAAELITMAGAGVVAEPENPHSIANAVLDLYLLNPIQRAEMGRRGTVFYREQLSFKIGTRSIANLLQKVCADGTEKP